MQSAAIYPHVIRRRLPTSAALPKARARLRDSPARTEVEDIACGEEMRARHAHWAPGLTVVVVEAAPRRA